MIRHSRRMAISPVSRYVPGEDVVLSHSEIALPPYLHLFDALCEPPQSVTWSTGSLLACEESPMFLNLFALDLWHL